VQLVVGARLQQQEEKLGVVRASALREEG
jgi:hypothetical protein